MTEKRIGRQTPTTGFTLPYQKTHGADAVEICELSGRRAQEWQQALVYDIPAVSDEGKWVHTKFGYSVPRQNGKGEVLIIRELYGPAAGQRGLHTAHRTSTEHAAWERICGIPDKIGVPYSSVKAKGQERIEVIGGGKIGFRTRTAKGGIGSVFSPDLQKTMEPLVPASAAYPAPWREKIKRPRAAAPGLPINMIFKRKSRSAEAAAAPKPQKAPRRGNGGSSPQFFFASLRARIRFISL